MNYIDIKGLNYTYPDRSEPALEDIDLEIKKGDFILLLGKSGSGKSTLIKCMAGTIPNFYGGTISGEIILGSKEIEKITHSERAREITMVFQDPERQLVMNKVHREIAFGLENVGIPESQIKRKVWEALQFLNIVDLAYRDINTLSGGQKQKVAIASAVAYLPNCIILDEPTSQLDPASAEEIVNLVKKINEELGITVIIAEQRVGKWFEYADRIIVLNEGRVFHSGSRSDMYLSGNKNINGFMPSYLRLCKALGIKNVPKGIKEGKECLKNYKINRTSENSRDEIIKELIHIDNLTCKYEEVEAVKHLSFSVFEGDFFGILGSNGAGKSTLLKSIAGLVKYSGSIRLPEGEVKKLKLKELSRIVGYVSQNPNDYISKDTVFEELKFTLDNYGIYNEETVNQVMRDLNIYHLKDNNPRDISGGERQRVAIAAILVLKPRIILLDEPTRGLHGEAKKNLGELLAKLNRSGATVILITHDIEFASQFCNHFLLMFGGERVAEGDAKEVLGKGIYYTTTINKLLRNINEDIFTLEQALNGEIKNEEN